MKKRLPLILFLFCFLRGSARPASQPPAEAADLLKQVHTALSADDYEAAVPLLRATITMLEGEASSTSLLSESYYNLAVCLQKTGQIREAIDAAKHYSAYVPDSVPILKLLGKLYFTSGDYENAGVAFEQAKQLSEPTPTLLRQLAQVHIRRKSQQKALESVNELLARDSSTDSLTVALEGYLSFSQDTKTIDTVKLLRKRGKAHPFFHYAAGLAHARLEHFQEAEAELNHILDHPVYGDDALFELGVALSRQEKRKADAKQTFARLLVRDPYYTPAYFQLSMLLFRTSFRKEGAQLKEIHGKLQESEEDFRKQRKYEAAGLSVEAAVRRALGYERQRQYRKAEEVLRSELSKRKGNQQLLMALGMLLFHTERIKETETMMRRLRAAPDVALLIGTCLEKQGKIDEALQYFKELTETPALSAASHMYRGKILLDHHDAPRKALSCFRTAAALKAGLPGLDLYTAQALFECKEIEKAKTIFEQISAGQTRDKPLAQLYLAWCMVRLDEPEKGLSLLSQLHGTYKGSGRYFTIKREALEQTGDKKAAGYKVWEKQITSLEKEAQLLHTTLACESWPQACTTLLKLSLNAEQRHQRYLAGHYAFLATEADPNSAEALRRLLSFPLTDFIRLSKLTYLLRLKPDDRKARAEAEKLRTKYGLPSGEDQGDAHL